MAFDFVNMVLQLVIQIIIFEIFVAPSLWIAGRLLAGKEKAKFTDALWIVLLGCVIYFFFNLLVSNYISGWGFLVALLVEFIIWLALVKHFFDCGWLKALAITVIAVIVAIVILFIIAFILILLGVGTGLIPLPTQATVI
jgi:hypothetical protein